MTSLIQSCKELNDKKELVERFHLMEKKGKKVTMIKEILRDMPDLERLIGKIITNRIFPQDILNIESSLRNYLRLKEILVEDNISTEKNKYYIERTKRLLSHIEGKVKDDYSKGVTTGGFFNEGQDAKLDKLNNSLKKIRNDLKKYKEELLNDTNIPFSIFSGANNAWHLEVPAKKLPAGWKKPLTWKQERGTTINDRFSTPELNAFYMEYIYTKTAKDKREYDLLCEIRLTLLLERDIISDISEFLAKIDVIQSYSSFLGEGWVYPKFLESGK